MSATLATRRCAERRQTERKTTVFRTYQQHVLGNKLPHMACSCLCLCLLIRLAAMPFSTGQLHCLEPYVAHLTTLTLTLILNHDLKPWPQP